MKKDIEWAIKEIEGLETETSQNYPHDEMIERGIALGILSRLDEPEVLSQEEVDQAYKSGYETGKQHTFYKGYLEGLADKENKPETVADVVTTFWKSYERLKKVMSMEVEELEE